MAKRCTDTAVYWAPSGWNADGSPSWSTAVEISCLWMEERKLFRDREGRETVSQASVYVLQDLSDNGMLYEGELADLTAAQKSDPRKVKEAYEIKRFMKKPSLLLTDEYNRKAIL